MATAPEPIDPTLVSTLKNDKNSQLWEATRERLYYYDHF